MGLIEFLSDRPCLPCGPRFQVSRPLFLKLIVFVKLFFNIHWNSNTMRPNTTLYRIQSCFFLDPKLFSKNYRRFGRHTKFIYYHPYHRILTQIFSLVEKKTDVGSLLIYKYGHISTKIFNLDDKTD